MTENNKIIEIIIPVYNGEKTLIPLTERIHSSLAGHPVRLLFVDDGSRDATRAILRELAAEDSHVRFIGFSRNFGHQAAMAAGIPTLVVMRDAQREAFEAFAGDDWTALPPEASAIVEWIAALHPLARSA